jgi:uncharacterized protein with von Willebrand factor type A (vWA) domain
MTSDDLLKMLDIKPEQVTAKSSDSFCDTLEVNPHQSKQGREDSVVKLTEWDLEQGMKIRETSALPLTDEAVADFFAVSFMQSPELTDGCHDRLRQQFVENLLKSPDYEELHQSTQFNQHASETAARKLADEFYQLATSQKDDPKSEARESGDVSSDLASEMECIASVMAAVTEAQKEVDELEEAGRAFGLGQGAAGTDADQQKIAEVFSQIKNNPTLREIIRLAGRYRRSAQAHQRQKVTHGNDEMVGVTLDGDVGRLVPTELAALTDELLELDAMRRLVERQSMCREYQGVESQDQGPIVVCVDESDSMNDDRVCQAKAFALAMAWIARHQKRWICLIGYSGGTTGNLLVIPPGKSDESELIEWLIHFYGGGTTMDVPLAELPTTYWDQIKAPRGKTDLVLITDAIVRVPNEMRVNFLKWKEAEKVKVISLIIGSSQAGDLEHISDETIPCSNLSVETVAPCLSI